MTDGALIELRGVTKRYGGLVALEDLTLSLGASEVFGFIGPNGAGKSTTMKILACLLRADAGEARVCGCDVRTRGAKVRRLIGYMPDVLGVYDDLTVDEYLQFFAAAYEIPRARRRAVVDSVLELTDLGGKRTAMVDSLSRGMTQRLGVARVLLHEPRVLLLDEPASGLDPRARIELRELLLELRAMGKCIMVSSHILSELGEMCTSIGIIERGRLIYSGSIADAYAKAGAGQRIAVSFEDGFSPGEEMRLAMAADARVADVSVQDGQWLIELVAGEHSHHFLIERMVAAGARIASFTPRAVKLEDAFLRLTKGALN